MYVYMTKANNLLLETSFHIVFFLLRIFKKNRHFIVG